MIDYENLKKLNEHFYDHHIYAIRYPRRDKLKQDLQDNGVKTEINYPVPPHKQKAYDTLFNQKKFSIYELIHQTILSLPISFCHSENEIKEVVVALKNFLNENFSRI